jgi:ParB family chromosome partitioning protein
LSTSIETAAAGVVDPGVFYPQIPIDTIKPSPTNPRKRFDETEIQELAASIKEKGLIQPIVIRPAAGKKKSNEQWEIVAGERRWRASKLAGLDTIAAIARNLDDRSTLELQVIENLQRADVHELDEAGGYRKLMEDHGYTVEVLAEKVGKSIAYIYGRLKLNDLLPELQARFYKDELTAGHAILLARLSESSQIQTAKEGLFDSDYDRDAGKQVKSLVSVRELGSWIATNIQMELAKAPFDPKDATLLPAAGACITCPKRSGCNPVLFPELGKKDVCTDRACYDRKVSARIKTGTASGELVPISHEYDQKKRPKGALYEYDSGGYRNIRDKSDNCKYAEAAIHVDGHRKGEQATICRNRQCREHFAPSPRTKKTPKELAGDRAKRLKGDTERKFRQAVHAKVCAKLKDGTSDALFVHFSKQAVLSVIAGRVFARVDSKVRTDVCNDLGIKERYGDADRAARKKFEGLSIDALIRLTLRMISADCLHVSEWATDFTDGSEDLLTVAGALGVGYEKIRTEVAAEMKEKVQKKATAAEKTKPAKKAAKGKKAKASSN